MVDHETLNPTAELDAMRQQLLQAQKLSSVGMMASSVAHEFNNILTTILNSAKLGMRSTDPAAQAQAFDRILRGGQRAAVIVNSMLGYARNSNAHHETTDLVKLVEDVLVLTDKDLAKHRVQVEKRFHGRPTAMAAAGQIQQILTNLVLNARQAMPHGGRLRIEVRELPDGETSEIKLSDTGVGIPPENLRLIFEPFFTTKQPDEHGSGGTGLGLSVCRQIIEQHHGRIRVESVVGKGSTFTIKLPKKRVEEI